MLFTVDDVEFDLKTLEYVGKYEEHVTEFSRYFQNCIENLKAFVWEPRNNKAVPIN